MIIKEWGLDDLEKARDVQEKAKELSLLSIPVMHYNAQVFDENRKQLVDIKAKSNSYTRNALNTLAINVGFTAGYFSSAKFGDNFGGLKDVDDAICYKGSFGGRYQSTNSDYVRLVAGSSDEPETVDSYKLENEYASGSGVGNLMKVPQEIATFFDGVSRKLYTHVTQFFINDYDGVQDVNEIGIEQYMRYGNSANNNVWFLLVRDVLPEPIEIPAYGSINFQYVTEIQY